MSDPQYIVGIDLGTTHCVVGWAKANLAEDEAPEIQLFLIPQVISPGEVKAQPLLPSFLLLPGAHDVPEGALALPWDMEITWVAGEYARDRGSELPNRLVSSAKSWLCHTGVDRTEAILPWEAPQMHGASRRWKRARAIWSTSATPGTIKWQRMGTPWARQRAWKIRKST
jgi:molecular chaperone DnaK (HSP70)